MRFKQWLEFQNGTTSLSAQSGVQNFPGANLNTNLPVRSKISCKDGSDEQPLDSADKGPSPDNLFGFKSPTDKNAANKRKTDWINKNSRRALVTTIPPDITY